MSLLQGILSPRRFMVIGSVPTKEKLLDGLRHNTFRQFEDGSEEERVGWCDWRNLLITPPDEYWVDQGRFAVFSLRIDTRKVPGILLKAKVDLRLKSLEKNSEPVFISREMRVSIQDEVKSELLPKVLPNPKVFEVVWDLKGAVLLTTASSSKSQSTLTSLFIKSFGCELHPITPLSMASCLLPNISLDSLIVLDKLDLTVETT